MKTRISNSGYKQFDSGNGWEYTHRKVAEKNFGSIPEGHQVHHKNANKLDNRPENLEVLSKEDHRKIHNGDASRSSTSSSSSSSDYDYSGIEKIDGDDWYICGGTEWCPVENID